MSNAKDEVECARLDEDFRKEAWMQGGKLAFVTFPFLFTTVVNTGGCCRLTTQTIQRGWRGWRRPAKKKRRRPNAILDFSVFSSSRSDPLSLSTSHKSVKCDRLQRVRHDLEQPVMCLVLFCAFLFFLLCLLMFRASVGARQQIKIPEDAENASEKKEAK